MPVCAYSQKCGRTHTHKDTLYFSFFPCHRRLWGFWCIFDDGLSDNSKGLCLCVCACVCVRACVQGMRKQPKRKRAKQTRRAPGGGAQPTAPHADVKLPAPGRNSANTLRCTKNKLFWFCFLRSLLRAHMLFIALTSARGINLYYSLWGGSR